MHMLSLSQWRRKQWGRKEESCPLKKGSKGTIMWTNEFAFPSPPNLTIFLLHLSIHLCHSPSPPIWSITSAQSTSLTPCPILITATSPQLSCPPPVTSPLVRAFVWMKSSVARPGCRYPWYTREMKAAREPFINQRSCKCKHSSCSKKKKGERETEGVLRPAVLTLCRGGRVVFQRTRCPESRQHEGKHIPHHRCKSRLSKMSFCPVTCDKLNAMKSRIFVFVVRTLRRRNETGLKFRFHAYTRYKILGCRN